jgi:tetratricopeptide (TPR) repeat protein
MPRHRTRTIQEISVERTQRTFIKVCLGVVVAVILLVLLGWAGYKGYVRWQERRLTNRAKAALAENDLRTASLAARTVMEMKPDSTSAARVLAEVAERTSDRAALGWRRNVLEAQPNSIEDRIALARSALLFKDITLAAQVLDEVDQRGRQTAEYHAAAAMLAQARKENEAALQHWQEAVRLAPNDQQYQLQLAVASMASGDAAEQQRGETNLRHLQEDPKQRGAATRALISDAVAKKRRATDILALGQQLQSYPEATFNDRLLYLDLLHQVSDAQFVGVLGEMERKAADKPDELAVLLTWMTQNGLALIALDYIKTLPPDMIQQWPVPISAVRLHVRLKDWQIVEDLTKNSNWRDFEFLRHAYLSRALREQNKTAPAHREWDQAVKQVSGKSNLMSALITAVSEWQWIDEVADLLWQLADTSEQQQQALQTLYTLYSSRDDTRGLYRVLVKFHEIDAKDMNLQNNLAQIGLLLNASPQDARRLATDLFHRAPENPAYRTTYAYALLTNGNAPEAVKIMSQLTPEQLQDPSISAYYGMCLAAVNDPRAAEFLDRAKAAKLLPEEREALEKAAARVKSQGINNS